MVYELVGNARYKNNFSDTGINLEVRSMVLAGNDDEAKANINQALEREGYPILSDGTLSPAQPWEWVRVELREIRSVVRVEFKKAQPPVLAF